MITEINLLTKLIEIEIRQTEIRLTAEGSLKESRIIEGSNSLIEVNNQIEDSNSLIEVNNQIEDSSLRERLIEGKLIEASARLELK